MYRSAVKEPDGVFDELGKSVVFVYVFASVEGFCFYDNPGCADIIPAPTDQSIPGNHEMHHPH